MCQGFPPFRFQLEFGEIDGRFVSWLAGVDSSAVGLDDVDSVSEALGTEDLGAVLEGEIGSDHEFGGDGSLSSTISTTSVANGCKSRIAVGEIDTLITVGADVVVGGGMFMWRRPFPWPGTTKLCSGEGQRNYV